MGECTDRLCVLYGDFFLLCRCQPGSKMDRLKLRCCCYCKAGGENGWQEEEETLKFAFHFPLMLTNHASFNSIVKKRALKLAC
jgi:hypothetical protein